MEVILLALMSLSNIVCFLVGARVGQKVTKDEEVKVVHSPMELYREHEARKEADRVKDKIDTIMRNIDHYDGTAYGQEDVPR